jgi:hypothetical protein
VSESEAVWLQGIVDYLIMLYWLQRLFSIELKRKMKEVVVMCFNINSLFYWKN